MLFRPYEFSIRLPQNHHTTAISNLASTSNNNNKQQQQLILQQQQQQQKTTRLSSKLTLPTLSRWGQNKQPKVEQHRAEREVPVWQVARKD